jgi:hypothetical protein
MCPAGSRVRSGVAARRPGRLASQVPALPEDADAMTDLLSELRGGRRP